MVEEDCACGESYISLIYLKFDYYSQASAAPNMKSVVFYGRSRRETGRLLIINSKVRLGYILQPIMPVLKRGRQ